MDSEIDASNISTQSPGENQTSDQEDDDDFFVDQLLLTDLPEVVLINIMEYLLLKERYSLSQTCHLFHDLFSHPHLWRDAHISLLPVGSEGKNRRRWKMMSVMNHTMAEIVRRFSHLFQHLTLEMSGYVQALDQDCLDMIAEMNEECRLESLTLAMGSMTSKDDEMRRVASVYSNVKDVPVVVQLVKNAVRMRHLSLLSWPLHKDLEDSCDIFKAIIENQKLQYLESFNFFFLGKQDKVWTERIPHLPSPETTLKVISHLKSLKHLSIRSTMLSNELLLNLAKKDRSRLESLHILVMYARDSFYMEGFKIPELDSSSWKALKMASPHLKVECFVVTRIPENQLSMMLNREMPLHALNILKYGRCDNSMIHSLADKFKQTLCKFVSLCDSSDCDLSLLDLVENCKQLRYLSYHGEITTKTVVKISEIFKERKVNVICFEFLEKSIKTNVSEDDEVIDDDLAVARDEQSQELYIVGLRKWHDNDEEKPMKIDSMSKVVSDNLGLPWRPI